jgi:YVTN family beta-propeller protein
VSVIDTSTNSVTATVTVGTSPVGVAVSPDGSTAYVPNSSSGTVSVIDTSTNSVTATVTVGSYPADVAFTPNSATAYVSNYFSGSVSVIATGLGASSGGGSSGGGGGSARAVPQVVSVDLDLEAAELPAASSQSAILGSWYQLPASADVVGVGENAGKTFLGVATREDFPVAIAQRQVDNGWGVYEIYDADGRLESVFILAGKSLHLTAAPRLHAIWSQ